MAQLAAWLIARPQFAILALVITALARLFAVLGAGVAVLLVLRQPAQVAALVIGAAAFILVAAGAFAGVPIVVNVQGLIALWVPAVLLALLLKKTRSVTLTLQLSVIAMIVIGTVIVLLIGDTLVVWQSGIDYLIAQADNAGAFEIVEWVQANAALLADWLTVVVITALWLTAVVGLMIGYWLSRKVGGDDWGQICDVDFGKVVAVLLLVVAVVGMLTGNVWIQAIGAFLLVVFFIQGLMVVHWLLENGLAPVTAVITMYIILVLVLWLNLAQYVFAAMAVVGYIEAWLRYRRRVITKAE
ncbi:MAG: hypothetical protein AAF351_05330 [Pseudomonadota bacterium]